MIHSLRFSTEEVFFEAAKASLSYAKRNIKSVSLAMIDIDLFKAINDNYGHHTGDEVLKEFATIMCECFRDSDIIGRLGGEEFCVLLTDSNLLSAKEKLDMFRDTVEKNTINIQGEHPIKFTISVGLTESEKNSEYNLDAMLKQADKYLYQAKDSGRNKVCL